ncbi:MAG: polyprenyl synthetase family protein [Acidobacteriota bacterium]
MANEGVTGSSTAALAAYMLVAERLELVEREIERACHSEIALVRRNAEYLHRSGGKRLRPAMVLLCAQACGYEGEHDVQLGAVVEFIHTATLVHDDIVDDAKVRRGHAAANQVWGNKLAVLLGDYIYIRSMAMSVALGDLRLVEVLTEATSRLLEGEILDVSSSGDSALDKDAYLRTIERKTASLFAACGQASAILAGAPAVWEEALASYGSNIGMAFQLVDDLLDYHADPDKLGKKTGGDLGEGKLTLPAIYLLRDGGTAAREHLLGCFGRTDLSEAELRAVVDAMAACGALDAARADAKVYADRAATALDPLPDSRAKEALASLPEFVLARQM